MPHPPPLPKLPTKLLWGPLLPQAGVKHSDAHLSYVALKRASDTKSQRLPSYFNIHFVPFLGEICIELLNK